MATARDIIKAALRRIGVLPAGAEPSDSEAVDALEALNDMGASFNAKNVYTGWSPLGLNDPIFLDERHTEGLKSMLARQLCPDYGIDVSRDIEARANAGWALICADYMAPETLRVDSGLRVMPSQRIHWIA